MKWRLNLVNVGGWQGLSPWQHNTCSVPQLTQLLLLKLLYFQAACNLPNLESYFLVSETKGALRLHVIYNTNKIYFIILLSSNHHVLDVGSGLGGPARYLANKTGCLVTAIELQDDLHKEAENLTQRCNLQQKLKHITGDFLQMDLGGYSYQWDFFCWYLNVPLNTLPS